MRTSRMSCLAAVILLAAQGRAPGLVAQDDAQGHTPPAGAADDSASADSAGIRVRYRNHRIEMDSDDGNWMMTLQWRFQFRFSAPYDGVPETAAELDEADAATFRIRRARLKVGGHAYRPWLQYYLEYDFPSTNLLDWRLTLGTGEAQARVGQWKVNFSRERVSSSGEQQFVERSIVNETFTLDRQVGVMLLGHLLEGTPGDVRYYAGAFTGNGSNASANDDGQLLWLGRLEWQPLGRDPEMEAGDLERRERPALTIAVAGATNRSPYTRFSGSGGGQLPGFADGDAGRYRVRQAMVETAFKFRGISWQHESHLKEVDDREGLLDASYDGTYVQAGVFPAEWIAGFPEPLEVGARWAGVNGGPPGFDRRVREVGGVANWYFAGHKNKLTLDVFRSTVEEPGGSAAKWRGRLQWDVSF